MQPDNDVVNIVAHIWCAKVLRDRTMLIKTSMYFVMQLVPLTITCLLET